MLANRQNIENSVSERSYSEKKTLLKVNPPAATITSRSANDQRKASHRQPLVTEHSNQPKIFEAIHNRKQTPLNRPLKKDSSCQTENTQPTFSESDVLDWMCSDEEPSVDYWKELANSRDVELRKVVEECDSLKRQIELVSNLNSYLMEQLDERENELSALKSGL